MTAPLRLKTKVLPGHRIEITDPELPVGGEVDVIVLPQAIAGAAPARRSALDIIESYEGPRMFKTAEEVDAYLNAERDSWER